MPATPFACETMTLKHVDRKLSTTLAFIINFYAFGHAVNELRDLNLSVLSCISTPSAILNDRNYTFLNITYLLNKDQGPDFRKILWRTYEKLRI